MLKIISLAAAVLAIGLAVTAGPRDLTAAELKSPIVVELYTSQGCSSCPPAEAYLGELAKRPDVIALELHVDYWDYIGWKDPFASHIYVERQRGYSGNFGERYVYTPQMVIQGRSHAVGSDKGQVEAEISAAKKASRPGPKVVLTREGDMVRVTVDGQKTDRSYDVLFVTFDKEHQTKVARGENRGRTLINTNTVRALETVGQWSGHPVQFAVSIAGKKGDGGCAVIVQETKQGPILTAAVLPYRGS